LISVLGLDRKFYQKPKLPLPWLFEAAATAAAAAATNDEDEMVRDEGRKDPVLDEALPIPADARVDSFECLLLREEADTVSPRDG